MLHSAPCFILVDVCRFDAYLKRTYMHGLRITVPCFGYPARSAQLHQEMLALAFSRQKRSAVFTILADDVPFRW